MQNPIIEINNVKKLYRVGQIGGGTLTADLQSLWAKIMRKEDPNRPLFQEERLVGSTFMALNGVSFTVNKGEAVGIIGGNGAGKSTLLKILSRVTAPTDGEIVLRGRVASMLEVGTGFNGEMTGRENIYMNGAILGMSRAEIDGKIEGIIQFSECGDFIDTPVKRYSSGMYVKLAFAVASHLDSEIMIMDEVLAVGDVNFQKKCLNRMSDSASEEGKTVLYVSHNMATVRQLCNRVVVLKDGRVVYDGDVEKGIEIYSQNSVNITTKRTFDVKAKQRYDAYICETQLLNTENGCFSAEQKVRVAVKWFAKRNLSSVRFNMQIKSCNQCIATMLSEVMDIEATETPNESVFEIDISQLSVGSYDCDLYIGGYNVSSYHDYGAQPSALSFQITENKNQDDVVWPGSWSNMVIPLCREVGDE